MGKSSCKDMDMDMEDWEVLQVPNDSRTTTTFDLGLERGKEDLQVLPKETNFGPAAAFVDNHYFILPSKNQEVLNNNSMPEKLAAEEEELESLVEFKDIGVVAELSTREDIVARIGPEPIYSGDEEEEEEEEEEEGYVDHDGKEEEPCSREEGCGLKKVWSWKLVGGVGALCSIGVAAAAAAAICVLVLGGGGGGRQQPSCETHSQTQRLPFQIYADEKRIKQVVQQATRLNQALTAARGVPAMATRANISFGGYYDGL